MTSLIEEFYYTNFNEDARNAPSLEQCPAYTEKAYKLQAEFLATLQEDQLKLYEEYDKVLNDMANITNRENFIAGFRFGARFAFDTFA